jgi:hypothetical protein
MRVALLAAPHAGSFSAFLPSPVQVRTSPIPGTEMNPLATIVGALARYNERE